MKQFNLNLTAEFERDLKKYMSIKQLTRKADAIRMALAEIVSIHSQSSKSMDFRDLLGAGLKAPLNNRPTVKVTTTYGRRHLGAARSTFQRKTWPRGGRSAAGKSRLARNEPSEPNGDLILVEDRQPALFPQIRRKILESGIRFVPVSVTHAELASEARMNFPLNLGDRFAYALAHASGDLLLTVDEDFNKCDVGTILP